MINLVNLTEQYHSIQPEIDKAISEVLESGHFILGPTVSEFEKAVAKYLGVEYAIGVASGTDAIVLSLRAVGIGPGDEVIVPAYTFFATAGAVLLVGAKPVFVDINPATYAINTDLIEEKISPKTRAIIPVHLYGHPAEMEEILLIGQKHGLKIIEDNAQAFGSMYKGQKTGSIGDVGCLSFFPTKNLGAFGDAGMVVTNDPQIADQVKRLRTHGWQKKYFSEEVGYNSRLDAIQAAILNVKLPYVDEWNNKRREIAEFYNQKIALLGLQTPIEESWGKHVYHLYIIRCQQRDKLQAYLKENSIASEVYYPLPPHLAAPCQKLGYKKGDYPEAEKASQETLALPMYPELLPDQYIQVIESLQNFFSKYA